MAKKMAHIKNFIFLIIFVLIISFISGDTSRAYADETTVDYSKYYYMQLSKEAKFIYDTLLDNIDATKTGDFQITRPISTDMFNVLKKDGNTIVQSAIDAFDRDHPEVFWIEISKIQMKFKSDMIIFEPTDIGNNSAFIDDYAFSELPEESFYNDYIAADSILNDIQLQVEGMSAYEKVKYVHDYLVQNNDYNSDISTASSKAYKSISAIIGNIDNENSPVCEGYARAFKVICDELDIPCVIVSGDAEVEDDHLGHMWNYVKLDDKWYVVDVTWDDPVMISGSYEDLPLEKKYEYFLVGKEKEKLTHTPWNVFVDKEDYTFSFDYPSVYPLDYGDETPLYSITITKYSNGVITTDVDNEEYVIPGTKVNIHLEIKDGMKLIENSLKVNGKAIADMYFIMPSEDVVITAAFMTDTSSTDKETEKNEDENTKEPGSNEDAPSKPTKEPDKEPDDKEEENNKNPSETVEPEESDKKPIDTSKPTVDKEENGDKIEDKPQNSVPPNKPAEDNKEDLKNEPSQKEDKDDKESDVILVEDNFDVTNPLADIKIINKAAISMSNKDVVYSYQTLLNDKNITFYIGNAKWSDTEIKNIISSEYLVKDDSDAYTLQILVSLSYTNICSV